MIFFNNIKKIFRNYTNSNKIVLFEEIKCRILQFKNSKQNQNDTPTILTIEKAIFLLNTKIFIFFLFQIHAGLAHAPSKGYLL